MHALFTFATLAWLTTIPAVIAQSPDQIPITSHSQDVEDHRHSHALTSQHTKRVAIIGAGSAGTSTAHYLRKYADNASIPLNITIYERNAYIGGRSTTVDAWNDPSEPIELGASIFVRVNRNLVAAAEEFNLSTSSMRSRIQVQGTTIPALGIWDGTEWVLRMASEGGWWENAKLLWRYGMAPVKTIRLMRKTVATFLKIYEEPHFPFASLTETALELGLLDVTAVTGEQLMSANAVEGDFGRDVVQASTRVNYAQNLNAIHGLEAMVCMAAEGAMSIEGGNWRIFDAMAKASGAEVRLKTSVGLVKKGHDGKWTISSRGDNGETNVQTYDELVLAAPKQYSGIQFPIGEPEHRPDQIPYVHLQVTLLASKHLLNPLAFNLEAGDAVPQAILTTLPKQKAHHSPDFLSISLLRQATKPNGETEYLYKIFSMEPPNSTFLGKIFGLGELEPNDAIDDEDISWIYRKEWQSYPYEYPRVTFEEIKLDEHFWYTSGIESFISTMETSSLMGMNVARLMVDEWIGKY